MRLQIARVRGLLGAEKAKVWGLIMGIKPWSRPHNKYVEYRVGQPIGAKTSWAVFALTHHTVLRLLCRFHRVSRECYVIIGDDIVISNENVANSYITLLNDFGVPYSKDKTISPYNVKRNNLSVAEFAKRLFCNGVEYSPLTSSLVNQVFGNKDWGTRLSLMTELEIKWGMGCWVTKPNLLFHNPAARLLLLLPKRRQRSLSITLRGQAVVANNMISDSGAIGAHNGVTNAASGTLRLANPFYGIDYLEFLTHLGEQVADHLQQYVNLLTEINRKTSSWGGTGGNTVTRGYLCRPCSPFSTVVSRIDRTIKTVYRAIANGDLNLQMVIDLGIDLGYTKELAYNGMSHSRYKRL